jgi:hypothetical protein
MTMNEGGIQKKFRNLENNQIEILEMKSSISQIKIQLKISPVDWIKLKLEYLDLKIRYVNLDTHLILKKKRSNKHDKLYFWYTIKILNNESWAWKNEKRCMLMA